MGILEKIKKNSKDKMKYINKILNPKKKYTITFSKTKKEKLISININDDTIIRGAYNFFGIYQQYTKLWIWASSIVGVDKRHVKIINKIREMSYLFEKHDDNRSNFYYQLLTEDIIYIDNTEKLNWINDMILFFTDDIYYFNPENEDGNIQFITLKNIQEKYN